MVRVVWKNKFLDIILNNKQRKRLEIKHQNIGYIISAALEMQEMA